ncbi:hypothetical protein [Microvirga alba]|uniref:Uncharacterized protein n=1 Tax=Microvirga alba TaxID=2791025 RepID=A0A931BNB8_9HYPH|nr:hypothetical protein [Microvirga alba]MBF9233098.1 hypothetical protein [Microvirga alba]
MAKNDLVASAARNNALWCDTVCRAHGKPGEFHQAIWLNRYGTPPFYPDAVTLDGRDASGLFDILADLTGADRGRGWAVKDSFHGLDLSPLGFETLFDAQWLCLETAPGKDHPGDHPFSVIRTEGELADWEDAWAGLETGLSDRSLRLFGSQLLFDPDIVVAAIKRDGAMVGGGILNRGAGVVGLSNLFALAFDRDTVRRRLAELAVTIFPGLPLVGYERGADLAAARRIGFEPIGDLRIWHRPA